VQWCEANDAQRTLGSYIAPDGSFFKQFDVLRGKLQDWQRCLRQMDPTNLQAKWRSFQTVFLKKVMYPLIGHSCRQDELQPIQSTVDREVLHILGLNEHFPRAVLYAPWKYGGLGCGTIHGQHVIEKVIMFLHHMKEMGQIREAMMTSMSTTQLNCGFSVPFFRLPARQWHSLVTKTWITHIWNECQPNSIDIRFHQSVFWVPKPVREGDVSIMDIAATMYDGEDLWRINLCRISLQVFFLSDIASVDGRRILLNYFHGGNHKASGRRARLHWPPVGDLPTQWWKLWKEFLIRWCGTALQIPIPLGRWFVDAEVLTQCCFFLKDRRLLMQHRDDLYELLPVNSSVRTIFQTQAFLSNETIGLSTVRVVDITYKHNRIYVIAQSALKFITTDNVQVERTLQDLYNNLSPELQRTIGTVQWPAFTDIIGVAQLIQEGPVIGVSDGSLRLKESKATHVWVIQAEDGREIRGSGPVDGVVEPRMIHRAELQGQTAIFLMIAMVAKLTGIIGGKVVTYCDNQAVVNKLKNGWQLWRYKNTKGAQTQLRQTLKDLKVDTEITYNTEWVQGHQERNGACKNLPRQVELNIRMDEDTKQAYKLPCQWQIRAYVPVFHSEGCAVYIGDTNITSNVRMNLRDRWHEEEAKIYLSQRHKIHAELFPIISWTSMRYALSKFSYHRRATAVKAIHRHLPTQAKLFKQG